MNEREYHDHIDPHRTGSRLGSLILGGQDGLVNVLSVLLGVTAATSDRHVALTAGLAAGLAGGLSMAGVAFSARRAERAQYESERARELRHVRLVPRIERDDVRHIFERHGLRGDVLDTVVEIITSNPETWVDVMMEDELHLTPVTNKSIGQAALIVGASSLLGSLVPLWPYLFLRVRVATICAIVTSVAVLFGLGAYKAATTIGSRWRSGLEVVLIGLVCALGGFAVGCALRVVP